MLLGAIICPSEQLRGQLQYELESLGGIAVVRALDRYPPSDELKRFIHINAPQIVFVSVEDLSAALSTAAFIEDCAPGTQVIAIGERCQQSLLLDLMRAGIREYLAAPFTHEAISDALARAHELFEKRPPAIHKTDLVFTFLPSKPGVGTSTVALNTAVALSKIGDKNTLLADFDLNLGLITFMLKMDGTNSVVEAAEHAGTMDEQLWAQLVRTREKLDVLGAGHLRPGLRIEASQVHKLLDYARRAYTAICVDLSGNLEKYSIEVMQESKLIFLVTTPEVPALHLARSKANFMTSQDLGDRVRLILNRTGKRDTITRETVEKLIGLPVHAELPNDYLRVHRALTRGSEVDADSELGKRFMAIAKSIQNRESYVKPTKRFVEYFSLVPARFN